MGGRKRGRKVQPQRGQIKGLGQQIQQLQAKMMEVQEALGQETVTVTAGGGAITVVMSGQQKIQSMAIDPEVVDPDDVEMLQDLIIAAVNEAVDKSQELAASRMSVVTGGLKIPGL